MQRSTAFPLSLQFHWKDGLVFEGIFAYEATIDIAPRDVAGAAGGMVVNSVAIMEETAAILDMPCLQASLRPFYSFIFHAFRKFA